VRSSPRAARRINQSTVRHRLETIRCTTCAAGRSRAVGVGRGVCAHRLVSSAGGLPRLTLLGSNLFRIIETPWARCDDVLTTSLQSVNCFRELQWLIGKRSTPAIRPQPTYPPGWRAPSAAPVRVSRSKSSHIGGSGRAWPTGKNRADPVSSVWPGCRCPSVVRAAPRLVIDLGRPAPVAGCCF
jgi:hypothetical protein